jgi:hypothetical protein
LLPFRRNDPQGSGKVPGDAQSVKAATSVMYFLNFKTALCIQSGLKKIILLGSGFTSFPNREFLLPHLYKPEGHGSDNFLFCLPDPSGR